IELTNADIRNSEAYKEYYAVATGATPPKTKSKEGSDDEQNSNEEGKEFIHPSLSIHDEENLGLNVGREEGQDEEDDEDELYKDVNINLDRRVVQIANVHTNQEFEDSYVTLTPVNPDGKQQSLFVSSQFVTSMLNPTSDAEIDSIFETTSQKDVQAPTIVAPLLLFALNLTPSTIATISIVPQAPTPPATASSTLLQDLSNFGSLFRFDHRIKTLEANFFEFVQTNLFTRVVSFIYGIVQRYMDQWMNVAVKALVEAYESDKIILDTYGDGVTLKRRHDDDVDKDEEPSAGSGRGSKRRREGKEPESASALKEKATRITRKESARDVYSKRRIIAVTELKIVEWHNYKHLDWIM
nr:hypothetical protein [Tanacetum cinerariifolium]